MGPRVRGDDAESYFEMQLRSPDSRNGMWVVLMTIRP
jgi:hypothetical protein